MSGGRAAIFAGRPRKSKYSVKEREDREGYKKAFGSMRGYNSKVTKEYKSSIPNPWND